MPEINGIEFAKSSRLFNQDVDMVFITSHSEFALQGYDVNAVGFIVKPFKQDAIVNCLNKIVQKRAASDLNQKLVFKSQSGVSCLSARDIVFFEASLHSTIIYTLQGTETVTTPFAKIKDMVGNPPFYAVHRSYIVNMRYVKSISNLYIVSDFGHKIPISKQNVQNFKSALFRYYEEGS